MNQTAVTTELEKRENVTADAARPRCRCCNSILSETFVDLGMSPPCESFLSREQLNAMEAFYPLHAWMCSDCLLVQLEEYVSVEEIFTEYAYFSSYSATWLSHASNYVDQIISRLGLTTKSSVVELASNDGYLLQNFVSKGIAAIGVEPARNVAAVAIERGINTRVEFFGVEVAHSIVSEQGHANLIIANNVLAQVPDLHDFVGGIAVLLESNGVATIEVPHLLRLIDGVQFDTIYHEHFSYFSLQTAKEVFARHGLTIFDVEELPTHGGSLRLYVGSAASDTRTVTGRVRAIEAIEREAMLHRLDGHMGFSDRVEECKRRLLSHLIQAKDSGRRVVGYGAPGKGNTLLNYCGIRSDLIEFTVDRNPYKHGKYLPGTHIPIHHPDELSKARPDEVVILPWNLASEIMDQLRGIREWGGRFVIPIPTTEVVR